MVEAEDTVAVPELGLTMMLAEVYEESYVASSRVMPSVEADNTRGAYQLARQVKPRTLIKAGEAVVASKPCVALTR